MSARHLAQAPAAWPWPRPRLQPNPSLITSPLAWPHRLVPTGPRALVTSIATALNWSSAWLVTFSFVPLLDAVNVGGVFAIYAGACALNVVFMAVVVPDRSGQTLEGATAPLARSDAVCAAEDD